MSLTSFKVIFYLSKKTFKLSDHSELRLDGNLGQEILMTNLKKMWQIDYHA